MVTKAELECRIAFLEGMTVGLKDRLNRIENELNIADEPVNINPSSVKEEKLNEKAEE